MKFKLQERFLGVFKLDTSDLTYIEPYVNLVLEKNSIGEVEKLLRDLEKYCDFLRTQPQNDQLSRLKEEVEKIKYRVEKQNLDNQWAYYALFLGSP